MKAAPAWLLPHGLGDEKSSLEWLWLRGSRLWSVPNLVPASGTLSRVALGVGNDPRGMKAWESREVGMATTPWRGDLKGTQNCPWLSWDVVLGRCECPMAPWICPLSPLWFSHGIQEPHPALDL